MSPAVWCHFSGGVHLSGEAQTESHTQSQDKEHGEHEEMKMFRAE